MRSVLLSALLVQQAAGFASSPGSKVQFHDEHLKNNAGMPRVSKYAKDEYTGEVQALPPVLAADFGGKPGFYHSVASGDPLHHSVILWTRFTPTSADEVVSVEFRMSKEGSSEVFSGSIDATPEHDWVVKLDVTGLDSGSDYHYQFFAQGYKSEVGMTKTAPEGHVEEMHYALFGCSNYGHGYFHAYNHAASMKKLDFWVHVGDYLYEYGDYGYPNMWGYPVTTDDPTAPISQWGRRTRFQGHPEEDLTPPWECITVADYRRRHHLYVKDRALSNLRKRAPLIAVWDDHEQMNNPYYDGAQNHQEICDESMLNFTNEERGLRDGVGWSSCNKNEGPFPLRMTSALQVYFEWMPIRMGPLAGEANSHTKYLENVPSPFDLTQVISWGDMATIVAYDTRLANTRRTDMKQGLRALGELGHGVHTALGFVPDTYMDVDPETYLDESTDVYKHASKNAYAINMLKFHDARKMLGTEQLLHMSKHFGESAAKGQPWQIWANQAKIGNLMHPNMWSLPDIFNDDGHGPIDTKPLKEALKANKNWKIEAADAMFNVTWMMDDWDGFHFEREQIFAMMQKKAKNPVMLAADIHDSFALNLFHAGASANEKFNEGERVGVNLVITGVTGPWKSNWMDRSGMELWKYAKEAGIPDRATAYNLLNDALLRSNPRGMAFGDLKDRGFVAFKVTHDAHVAEYIFTNDGPLSNKAGIAANEHDPKIDEDTYLNNHYSEFEFTAPKFCKVSLKTPACIDGIDNSVSGCKALHRQEDLAGNAQCEVEFSSSWPAAWSSNKLSTARKTSKVVKAAS